VKLWRLARARADEELRYSRELLETYNLETGGWLFGQYESGVWVLGLATGLGRDGRRMHERVRLDSSEAERAARDIRLGDSRMRLMGSWHCHPLWDAPRPSSAEPHERALAARLARAQPGHRFARPDPRSRPRARLESAAFSRLVDAAHVAKYTRDEPARIVE
jgi:hypothetical protein